MAGHSSTAEMPDILAISDRGDPPSADAARWIRRSAFAHIELTPQKNSRNLWAARLDEAVRCADRPVVLAAWGVGCFALAWWARLTPAPYLERVAGALLIAPLGSAVVAARGTEFLCPRTLFSFPSVVIEQDDEEARARGLAESWGSRLMDLRGLSEPWVDRMLAALPVGRAGTAAR